MKERGEAPRSQSCRVPGTEAACFRLQRQRRRSQNEGSEASLGRSVLNDNVGEHPVEDMHRPTLHTFSCAVLDDVMIAAAIETRTDISAAVRTARRSRDDEQKVEREEKLQHTPDDGEKAVRAAGGICTQTTQGWLQRAAQCRIGAV